MENQKKNQWISPEEAYIYVGQQKLRRGYTTGSCAAAAAQAAARVLFGEEEPKTVKLTVPKGLTFVFRYILYRNMRTGSGKCLQGQRR